MQSDLVEQLCWLSELSVAEEGGQKLEEVDQQLVEQWPALEGRSDMVGHSKLAYNLWLARN